jgi:PAB1-binding protein PBP1
MQQSQFLLESRIDRMASHFDSVLDTLRQDLETQYQTQAQRIERIGREARAAAVDEAHAVSERIVMNAAKRISDQVAESVLNVLKPAPTQHFR